MVWFENTDGVIYDWSSTISSDASKQDTQSINIDNNSLYATFSSLDIGGDYGTLAKIHYRIYADEIGGANV